ncbi:hypothetical protein Lwal_2185 [Legionella waltersii]|uniref:Uncharacterized protein n=2 Tax=Legionella waltersii TaxID=66969 RepID=A0A0W1A550_9GAMM|nr:hypothetical protein Lwal_2185 [Legionella waltersii]SNV14588.1 Uncharacterised protein [Legionella waltersii]
MLADLNSDNSQLQQEIEALPKESNIALYKAKLQMLIVWYEAKSLDKNRAILADNKIVWKLSGLIWDDLQIKIIPYLFEQQFHFDDIQAILFDEAFYKSINTLLELKFTKAFPKLISNPEKRELLKLINSIYNESARKLCLVFWVKDPGLNPEKLKRIVDELNAYPLLAETLIALDSTGNIHINDLLRLMLEPKRQLVESILHHYQEEFRNYSLKKTKLSRLSEQELNSLVNSFKVLKENQCKTKQVYQFLIEDGVEARILRQFLPGIAEIPNPEYRKKLIQLLHIGVTNGFVVQGAEIAKITDPNLLALAKELSERFICFKQLHTLNLKSEMVEFAGKHNDPNAHRFRQVIMKVEEECKIALNRLSQSPKDNSVCSGWQKIETNYRLTLYSIAYDAIVKGTSDALKARLKVAEMETLNIVDPEIRQPLELLLIVLANILITAFTGGYANQIKEKNTGNYWFFTQTKTGEEIRALHKDISSIIEEAAPTLTS